jgi:hypothetical protein
LNSVARLITHDKVTPVDATGIIQDARSITDLNRLAVFRTRIKSIARKGSNGNIGSITAARARISITRQRCNTYIAEIVGTGSRTAA